MTLAERALTCKHWRWMPGMRAIEPPRPDGMVIGYAGDPSLRVIVVHGRRCGTQSRPLPKGRLPDLDEPATLGCLLALVRKALGDPTACLFRWARAAPSGALWECSSNSGVPSSFYGMGPTEAEALVAALEAAP